MTPFFRSGKIRIKKIDIGVGADIKERLVLKVDVVKNVHQEVFKGSAISTGRSFVSYSNSISGSSIERGIFGSLITVFPKPVVKWPVSGSSRSYNY